MNQSSGERPSLTEQRGRGWAKARGGLRDIFISVVEMWNLLERRAAKKIKNKIKMLIRNRSGR